MEAETQSEEQVLQAYPYLALKGVKVKRTKPHHM